MTHFMKTAIIAAVVAMPTAVLAGGYGTAGVKDATVGQSPTETASVWCPKLGAEVPVDLRRQMDCGDGVAVGTAKPEVARERFGGRGLFGLPPHQRSGPRSALDDDDGPRVLVTAPAGPDETPNERPTGNGEDEPTGGGSDTKTKIQRLGELGVTLSTIPNQSKEFQDSFNDYFAENGAHGDWSNFNPPAGGSAQE